jgi:putative ABC transport system permease protein
MRSAAGDAVALGWFGVRLRMARALMSALGISLGIATLVLVTGIPASGQAALNQKLNALGADVLVAQPANYQGTSIVTLPNNAAAMVRRIGPVEHASAIANLNLPVTRTTLSNPNDSAGISALAATPDLLTSVHAHLASGKFLDRTTEGMPVVVLGSSAAQWLGIESVNYSHPLRIVVGGVWFAVVGVLAPTPLTPELAQSVFVGWDSARTYLAFSGHPTVVYLRSREAQLDAVSAVLPATLDPALPGLISVTSPSEALAAKRATQSTFAGLFLGLASVALVVGGLGVANTMIVSVLERRREIGLRRALGASRRDIRYQFLAEAIVIALFGGAGGVVLGVLGTIGYALLRHWPIVLPAGAATAGILSAIVVGALAGLYPAARASRISPTTALASV